MTTIENLQKELDQLKRKREEETKIRKLKKEIRATKFAQTKGGKIFNRIGDFGLEVGRKLFTPTPVRKGKKHKPADINKIINSLPQ